MPVQHPADHVKVLAMALLALPKPARGRPILVRADSAGATHAFVDELVRRNLWFSIGFDGDQRVQQAILDLPEPAGQPAVDPDGRPRRGAWVAELARLELEASRAVAQACPRLCHHVPAGRQRRHQSAGPDVRPPGTGSRKHRRAALAMACVRFIHQRVQHGLRAVGGRAGGNRGGRGGWSAGGGGRPRGRRGTGAGAPMSVSLFEGVPADEVAVALAGLERRRFAAGSTVLVEGDYLGELYLVESGAADVFAVGRDGTEHHLARVGPRTTLGEMSLFTGQPASGTVRARTDLQVVVVTARALERLGDRLPRVYRNIGVILAERLAASTRLLVGDRPGRVTVLVDRGAPPDLAPAIAASVAWHTRAPVALTGPGGIEANEAHVLVRVTGDGAPPAADAPVVELVGPQDTPRVPERRLAVRGWVDGPVWRGPDVGGTVSIPSLTPADRAELARGVLSTSTPAGAALGWVARDVAGLKVGLALGAGPHGARARLPGRHEHRRRGGGAARHGLRHRGVGGVPRCARWRLLPADRFTAEPAVQCG